MAGSGSSPLDAGRGHALLELGEPEGRRRAEGAGAVDAAVGARIADQARNRPVNV